MIRHSVDKTEFHYSPEKIIWVFLGSVIFVGLCSWILIGGPLTDYEKAIMILGVLLFGYGTISSIAMMTSRIRKKAPLILSSVGFSLASVTTNEVISWNRIDRISEYTVKKQHFIGVWLRDENSYTTTWFGGMMLKLNRWMGYAPISIYTSQLDVDLEYLRKCLKKYYSGDWEELDQ